MAHLTRFLLQDHARINRAFDAYSKAPSNLDSALAACNEFEIHATVEEELVYPILRDELEEAKELVAAVQDLEPGDPELPELMQQLMRVVAAHVDHEESSVIPRLQSHLGPRVWDVGREAFTLRQELLGAGERASAQPRTAAHDVPNTGWGQGKVPLAGW
jgi:hemerythrin-like domain-containing protein